MTHDRTAETTEAEFYAIALTWETWVGRGREMRRSDRTAYFKADRYSPYSGRLQTTFHASDAQRFKTEKGARAAIARLLSRETIKPSHSPCVVRYRRTTTESVSTVEPSDVAAQSGN